MKGSINDFLEFIARICQNRDIEKINIVWDDDLNDFQFVVSFVVPNRTSEGFSSTNRQTYVLRHYAGSFLV